MVSSIGSTGVGGVSARVRNSIKPRQYFASSPGPSLKSTTLDNVRQRKGRGKRRCAKGPASRLALTFLAEHNAEPGLLSFFNSLPSKSPDSGTLRLFYRGGADNFYSAYGPDALFVVQHVFQTNTVIKYLGAGGRVGGLPSVALKTTVAHALLREALTTRQLRVEIYSAEPGKRASQFKLDKEASTSFSLHIFYRTWA